MVKRPGPENAFYVDYRRRKIFNVIYACLGMYGWSTVNGGELSNVGCLLTFAALLALFTYLSGKENTKQKQSVIVAIVLSMLLTLQNTFDRGITKAFLAQLVISFVGLYFVLQTVIGWVYNCWQATGLREERTIGKNSSRQLYMLSFAAFWGIYLLFLLNEYPGSLSCDTPAQLAEALGAKAYENANPAIHTLVLSIFVRIGILLRGDVNSGVALYTVFQFTFAAAVFAYAVMTIYRKGYNRDVVIFAFLFYGFVPYNIIYATGMWKDTFFAVLFLWLITYTWNCVEERKLHRYPVLFLLAMLTSLARNSGWSALLFFGIAMGILGIRRFPYLRKISASILLGVLSALVTITSVYPMLGIQDNGGITVALSVPLQQVARVVAYGGEMTGHELECVDAIVATDKIPELYDESISDPIKWEASANEQILKENWLEYLKIWVKIGLRNPKYYLDAYIALTNDYWHPNCTGWTWDVRIFENSFGVERQPVLLPDLEFDQVLDRIQYTLPGLSLFSSSGAILWLILICLGYASLRKNHLAILFFIPVLAVYLGLLITSPAALFRYVYCVAVCIPLYLCFPETLKGATYNQKENQNHV